MATLGNGQPFTTTTREIMYFRSGVFIITAERHCPLYNNGEEISVRHGIMRLPAAKRTCLTLAQDIIALLSDEAALLYQRQGFKKKSSFECGGCSGRITFEFKQEKEFATVQMKLLMAMQRKEVIKDTANFTNLLQEMHFFQPLDDDILFELASLMRLEKFPAQHPVLRKGDEGNNLYIILSGQTEVVDENGAVLAEMGKGDVFGEISMLSGESVTTTIITKEATELATLNKKDFQHLRERFPDLQVFFYKLLVGRITTINRQRAEELAAGMSGQLANVPPVELLQMINSNQKTGTLQIEGGKDKGQLLFNEGELITAAFAGQEGVEAFYAILALKKGRFQFTQGLAPTEADRDIIGRFMSMLMEGMKRLDDIETEEKAEDD